MASTLFLIHINRIGELDLKGRPYQFADDTALLIVCDNMHELQHAANEDMYLLNAWMNKHKMVLNVKKTKYMIFSNRQENDIDIFYNASRIDRVMEYKYLGLPMDPKLSWEHLHNHLKRKLATMAGIFWKIGKICPRRVLKGIYHSMFESHVAYGVSIWATATKQQINQLQVIQNRAIRNLFGEDRRISIKELHTKHNLMQIQELINVALSNHIHNISNGYVHSATKLVTNSDVHSYSTRNNNQLRPMQSNTMRNGVNALMNKAIRIYNSIPEETRQLSKQKFKEETIKMFTNRNDE